MKPWLVIILLLSLTTAVSAQKGRDETLAASYFQNGEYDKAAELYQSLWEKNAYAPQFYTPLFNTYLTLKKYDDAEKLVRKQAKKYDQVAQYQIDLGYLYKIKGEGSKSKEVYDKVIKGLRVSEPDIRQAAIAFRAYHESEYEIATYEKGEKIFKGNLDFSYELGGAYFNKGDNTNAAKYYIDNTGLSNEAITGLNNLVQIAGFFIQDEVTISPQNKLLFGCRFDYSTRSGPIATPRIDYKWNSGDRKNVFRIGAGTAYRVPNLLDEGFGALNGSRQVEIDGPLKTEYAVGLTSSYTRMQRFSRGAASIELGVFGTYLTNFVNPNYDTDSSKIIYANSNGGGTFGGNFRTDIVFDFPLRLGLSATYAYTFEIDKGDDGDIDFEIPTHSPPFTAQWYAGYTFAKAGVTVDYTANLVSPMLLATVDNDFRPSQSPWFSLENIQVTKRFKCGVEIFAGIKNFLNFKEQNPILRPFDPFNRQVNINNPNGYRFDPPYGYSPLEGAKGFIGFRYTLK